MVVFDQSPGWLQKAIRDYGFSQVVIEAVEENSELVWSTNHHNWTAMHIACNQKVSLVQWKWILKHASGSHQNLLSAETENGETPIDLFFRTWLFPFSWESRHKKLEALQLRNSIKEIYHSPKNVEEFKLYRKNMAEIHSRDEEDFFRASDFLERFECLLTVARFGNGNTKFRNLLSEEILSILAVLPWCPKDVAHLALCLYPPDENLLSSNKKQNPLHVWADSMSKQSFVQQQRSSGLLEILTQTISKEVLSKAASCQSANGRSPLHVALSLGRPWRDISILYDANPSMLQKLDTVYKIPVFCLPAIVSIDDKQVELIAKKRGGQCGVWRYLRKSDRASIKKEIRVTLETQTLNVVYQLLRKDPSAIKI